MNRRRSFFGLLLVLSVLSTMAAHAAVTVSINSGNPRYPFPQFMRYGSGLPTLAENNPDGLPHAEMEQWTRDAWQIFANQFAVEATYLGVNYIRANLGCPYDCTEGDGYALVAAAYMGDKTLFDGIWMRFHDTRLRKRPRYRDNVIVEPTYRWGDTPKDNTDSATDGDLDAALGLLMAWYQWGDLMGRNDSAGNPISYKAEVDYALKALVKLTNSGYGDDRSSTGEVGFDGYLKNGNTGPGETTNWANCPNGQYNGPACPEFGGPQGHHIDYDAPAYFHCFTDFLLNQSGLAASSFEVVQSQRAEAASDWLMGQMYAQNLIPTAGNVSVAGTTATFSNFIASGEDFRNPWRTVLNRVWNGAPTTTWNPTTHQTAAGSNTYEWDIGMRFGQFIRDPASFGGQGCISMGTMALTFNGVNTIASGYNPASKAPAVSPMNYALNWFQGTGSPSAIILGDFGTMADMFRQNLLEWDVQTAGDKYLTSVPVYFHGFFRWLGLDILAGNHPDPCDLVAPGAGSPPANLKVYKSVDRTYAFTGDTLTYWLNYRNYASTTATGAKLIDTLPAELAYVSSTAPGGSFSQSGQVLTWNLPNVTGFVSGGLGATMGGVTLVARVVGSGGRFCNTADISCGNGTGWTSNELPNEVSTVMRRNCVDIVPALLSITKTASVATACSGDLVTFTIDYKNNPGPWINGGRPGVRFSVGNDGVSASSNQLVWRARIFHGADEPVIDYGNYRLGYYLNDAVNLPGSWLAPVIASQGLGSSPAVTLTQQAVPPGATWNQRLLLQFPPYLAATSEHMQRYGPGARQHWGVGDQPMRISFQIHNAAWTNVNWTDDWSADPAGFSAEDGLHFPVTADWTAGDGSSVAVNDWHPDDCQTAAHTVNNTLVEEWDGYTWRRAFGNGPVSGRQMANVVISDILPACMTFGGFVGTAGTYNGGTRTVAWNLASLLVNETGQVRFWVTMGSCGGSISNTASISATNENAVSSSVTINPGAACGGTPTLSPTRTASPTLTRTATPTPSVTPSSTSSATRSATPSATLSGSPTRSATPSATRTATPSATTSPSPSFSPSASVSRSPSPSLTASGTQSASPTVSVTRTPSPTATASGSVSPSRTVTWTVSVTFLDTYTVSPTISPTPTATRTATGSATLTATRSATPSLTASPSLSASPTLSGTRTASPTETPLASATDSPSPSPTWSASPAYTSTATSTVTLTGTPTATPSVTRTATPSATATPTRTASPSATPTATPSSTQSPGPSPTHSATRTATATLSPTRTATLTATPTLSWTSTRTVTVTPTASPTLSPPPSPSDTPSISPTYSVSPTFTASPTRSINFYQQEELVKDRGIYPNPFSDRARIFFTLRTAATAKLSIYNVAGEPIAVLSQAMGAGKGEILWDGSNGSGGRCASGVYILRLQAEGLDGTTGSYWANAVIQR